MTMLLVASALLVLAVQPGESLGGVRKWKSAVRAEASRASHFAKPDFVTTRVDHFDGSNPDTWQQAYYVNDSYWKGPNTDAPVFLCVGGEGRRSGLFMDSLDSMD